jgi:hypothetical protein
MTPDHSYFHPIDLVASSAAVISMATPYWFPALKSVSETTALFLPLIGATVLLLQATYFILKIRALKKGKDLDK